MNTDFIRQQTTLPEKKYSSNVLIGNWQEEKCDPDNKFTTFYQERKFGENQYNSKTLQEENFNNSTQNWMQFRDVGNEQFVTMNMQEYKKPSEQKRNSELNKFITKKSNFEKTPHLIEEYREKWTKSKHVFDRTYLGNTAQQQVLKK